METIAKLKTPRVERGRTKIIVVPHEGREIAFAYPSVGPDTYLNVGRRILENGQNVPTGDQMASLLHAVYCHDSVSDEPEFKDVRDIMRNSWLWVFNRNLWTPEGVYVIQDLEAIGRSQPLNHNELEKMFEGAKNLGGVRFSQDGRVRFAQKGTYKLEKHTPESLAKDGFMVASYGTEGVEKLGEVSEKFRYSPRIWGVNVEKGQTPKQRVSALGGSWILVGGGLGVIGDGFVGDRGSRAFGVLK